MQNNELSLIIGTNLDTLKAENKLKEFTKTREIITKIKIDGEDALKRVSTYINNLGQKITDTKITDAFGNKLVNNISKTENSFKALTVQVDKYKNELGELITKTQEFDQNGNSFTTEVKKYTNAQGYLVEETRKLNSIGEQVGKTSVTMTRDLTKNLNEVNNSTKKVGQTFGDVIGKVAKFYLATLPIRAVQTAITDTIETVKEFDKAITEMGKVSNYSGEQLTQFAKTLGDVGSQVGRTRTEMVETATGWLKAGFSEEDAKKLSVVSALLQNTADEQLEASQATSILVSQLKAYGIEADNAIKVTDILNAVSAREAVSSGDLAKGLTQASASMATFGNDIEETTALLTAGTTIFQGKSQQVKMSCLLNIA